MNKHNEDIRRIISSKAFRRLAGKTQVFAHHEGDHFRTRLTHTIEVSYLARALAEVKEVDPSLAEAVALAHDLGHPPFGHSGEDELNQIMAKHGGFDHNQQTLRIIQQLESWNGKAEGLELSKEVLKGLKEKAADSTVLGNIINVADTVTYLCHDLEDALRAGILTLPQVQKEYNLEGASRYETINSLRNELLHYHYARIDTRAYLEKYVYTPDNVEREADKGRLALRKLYYVYMLDPKLIPQSFKHTDQSIPRWICDYIAGMTDRYALKQAAKYNYINTGGEHSV